MQVKYDRKLLIAIGRSRKASQWQNKEMPWSEFLDKLAATTRTRETVAEYAALLKGERDTIKDVGGFVGGYLKNGKRNNASVVNRCMLCLDADNADPGLMDDLDMTFINAYALYSTHSHTPEKMRLRLIVDKVRDAYHKALETPADENMFRQLRLNQWVKQSIRWMPMDKWDECGGVVDPYQLEGRACYAGLDLSSTSDLTTLVLVFPPRDENESYMVLPFFWLPEDTLALRVRRDHVMYDQWERQGFIQTTEGNVVHYGAIEKFICELGERYNIREIAYDRWNATMMVQTLEDDGFTMIPFGQGFRDMSPPTKELMRIVLEHQLNHGGHPVLRWNFDNAYVRTDPAGNLKLDKEKSTEKIDGAVALVMALDRAMKNQNGSDSVYDDRGLLLL